MKLQAWDLGLLFVFFTTFAIATDEMKVFFLGFCLRETEAGSMLPYIAPLTGNAR